MNKTINTLIHTGGRFAVAFGTFVALACAIAIIEVAPAGLTDSRTATADVVRLDPVVVTVSKAQYDAVRAEAARPSLFVRLFAKKPTAA